MDSNRAGQVQLERPCVISHERDHLRYWGVQRKRLAVVSLFRADPDCIAFTTAEYAVVVTAPPAKAEAVYDYLLGQICQVWFFGWRCTFSPLLQRHALRYRYNTNDTTATAGAT